VAASSLIISLVTAPVFAGKIASRSPCIGVATWTSGTTEFAECDADGEPHGRGLGCNADGHTMYRLCEHGKTKEYAILDPDGTCEYNGEACRADYPPFVALRLQAKGLAIKARPPRVPFMPPRHFFAPTARQSLQSAIVLALAGAGDRPRRQGAHLPPPPLACMPVARPSHSTAAAKQMRRESDLDDRDAAGGRVHYARDTSHMRSAPFRRPVHAQ
jgi:hypothetical protein